MNNILHIHNPLDEYNILSYIYLDDRLAQLYYETINIHLLLGIYLLMDTISIYKLKKMLFYFTSMNAIIYHVFGQIHHENKDKTFFDRFNVNSNI